MRLVLKPVKGTKSLELVTIIGRPEPGKLVDCGRYGFLRVYPDGSYAFEK